MTSDCAIAHHRRTPPGASNPEEFREVARRVRRWMRPIRRALRRRPPTP